MECKSQHAQCSNLQEQSISIDRQKYGTFWIIILTIHKMHLSKMMLCSSKTTNNRTEDRVPNLCIHKIDLKMREILIR